MIKERIIELIECKKIPKEDFYKKIGVTSANFRGNARKTPLNSNTIENVISEIPDVNCEWLMTGNGSMLKLAENYVEKNTDNRLWALIESQQRQLESQQRTIEALAKKGDAGGAMAVAR